MAKRTSSVCVVSVSLRSRLVRWVSAVRGLIASRWPLAVLPELALPQPERVLATAISTPWGLVELHAAHIPPGTAYGWIKIATLEAIFQRLASSATCPRILCGDFNVAPEARDVQMGAALYRTMADGANGTR